MIGAKIVQHTPLDGHQIAAESDLFIFQLNAVLRRLKRPPAGKVFGGIIAKNTHAADIGTRDKTGVDITAQTYYALACEKIHVRGRSRFERGFASQRSYRVIAH